MESSSADDVTSQHARDARSEWHITIEHGNLGFSAAHFVTFEHDCEPLHGHNYGVRVEVGGPLGPESYVLDFVVLKDIVRQLCKPWDHHFLLPLRNPHLRLTEHDDAWELEYLPGQQAAGGAAASDDRGRLRYVLPKWSVFPLDVDNVTAERLAQTLARQIIAELGTRGLAQSLRWVQVGVAETEMQSAFYSVSLRDSAVAELAAGG